MAEADGRCPVLARHAEHISALYGCGPEAELQGPVARGEQGEVWRLATSSGTWAVKLLFEQQDPADALADATFQDAVRSAGVPMPAVQRTVADEILCRIDDSWVRVYEWVDVLEPDPGLDPASVGALVAAIHGVRSRSPVRPVDPWYSEPVGADRWDELLAALAAREAPFAGRLADLRDELVALEGLLAPPRDLQVCHRDLWADNVRGTRGGGMCVIDWENGGLADPNQEIGIALFEFGLGDDARSRALYDAYLGAGGRGRIERAGDFSMLIAQLGHITEHACERWLESGTSEADRARAAGTVGELTGRPLTRETIERLLDALATPMRYGTSRASRRASATTPTLHGTRLRLRRLERADLPALEAIRAEPGVRRWWGEHRPGDLESPADGDLLAIDVEGTVAGAIQYEEVSDPQYRSAGIDLFLGAAWQGRGLGREAVALLVGHLIESRGHHRLTIDPASDNARAIRCYEAVGFARVGVMRQYEQAGDGTWRDGLLMELLADSWRPHV